MSRFRQNVWKRLFWGGLLLLCVVLLVRYTHLKEFTSFGNLVSIVEHARLNQKTIILFYIGYALAVMILPITLFPIVGGVLLNFWMALPLNILAATVGGFFSFCLSRYFGRSAVEILLRGKLKMLNHYTTQKGLRTVLFLRLIGIPPFMVTNYALGFSSMKKRHFILGTMIGILPWMVLVTYLSNHLWAAVLAGGEQGLVKALVLNLRPLGIFSLMILSTTATVFWLKRKKQIPQ